MRIAYISLATPFSRTSWSGIPWYTYRELKRRFPDTHVIETDWIDGLFDRIAPLERYGLPIRHRPFLAHQYSKYIDRKLRELNPDAVVAIGSAHKYSRLDRRWPLVYVADGLFDTIVGHYSRYARFSRRAIAAGNMLQQQMLERTNMILLASQWAADSAKSLYGLTDDQVQVLPFGANLDSDPGFQPPRRGGPLTLLFVGFEWQRKGGPLALEVWRELRKRAPDTLLHIVGSNPAEAQGLEGVHVHGPLYKNREDQHRKLVDLYAASSFFFMPTRQEAFGIVYAEAAAFGRPSIASLVGGVPTAVLNNETGLLLPLEASPADYADAILAVWNDPDRYEQLCTGARHYYETTLNWTHWGAGVEAALQRITAQP